MVDYGSLSGLSSCGSECKSGSASDLNYTSDTVVRQLPMLSGQTDFVSELAERDMGQRLYACPNDEHASNLFFTRPPGRLAASPLSDDTYLYKRYQENAFVDENGEIIKHKHSSLELLFRF